MNTNVPTGRNRRVYRDTLSAIAILLALTAAVPAHAIDLGPIAGVLEPVMSATERLEQANEAFSARQFADAGKIAEEILASRGFKRLASRDQYRVLWIAALSAVRRQDALEAHDYLLLVTESEFANVRDWKLRAQTAQQIEDWPDTLHALTTVAQRWPDKIGGSDYDDWAIQNAVARTAHDSNLRAQRLALLNALFDGNYSQQYGTQPSQQWLSLAAEALERRDLERARTIARRITSSTVLVQLRIDRRFDELVSVEPPLADVSGAAKREKERLAAQATNHPRSLGALAQYCYALFTVGGFKEMLKVSESAIEKVTRAPKDAPAYDDVDTYLAWMHNHRSVALAGLGRTDESVRALADWNADPRNTLKGASQSINLGHMHARAGRPKEALAAIEGIDWQKGLSPFGRMQLQSVRHDAYLQLGRLDDAQTVLAWIRQHQDEAPVTARAAFLEAGDLDAAAVLLISQLENPESRADVLASLQTFKRIPGPPGAASTHQLRIAENYRKLLERPDVVKTIDKYGRRESFPIYNLGQ
jgi:tetratricopeptide (TPR) repeat protein